jgi:hypothetical protein
MKAFSNLSARDSRLGPNERKNTESAFSVLDYYYYYYRARVLALARAPLLPAVVESFISGRATLAACGDFYNLRM